MEGLALMLSTICLNTTFCPDLHTNPGVNFKEILPNDLYRTHKAQEDELKKLADELKGQTLQVTTLEDYPLSYVEKENGTLVGKGLAFEFFEILMKKYDFKYNLIIPDFNILGGTNDSEGSLLQMLIRNKTDVAVAFVPMIADLLRYVLFSTHLDEGEWKILMTRPQESASGAGLLAPFHEIVWYYILVSLIVTGPAVWLIIWLYHRFESDNNEPYYGLQACVWFVYGGLMKQGSVLAPKSNSIRVAFASWWIFITILTSFYTANLTAFLTLARFSLPINLPQDIVDKRQTFISQRGFAVEYAIKNTDEELELLKPMVDRNYATFTSQNNDTDILLNLVLKKNMVFLRDKPAIDHLIYQDYRKRKRMPSERLQCPFAMSKLVSLRRRRGFAYPLGSKWAKLFDSQLRHLVEGGIVKHRLNFGLPKAEVCPQNLGSTERQLRLNDLMTTYLMMLVGFSSALVTFFGEMIARRIERRKIKAAELKEQKEQGTRHIMVQPSKKTRAAFLKETDKTISPPPAYGDAIKTIFNTQNTITGAGKPGKIESYRTLNGRTYAVVKDESGTQLVPTRAPSAALFNYQLAYNSYN